MWGPVLVMLNMLMVAILLLFGVSPDSFASFNLQPKAGFLNCEIA